MNAIMAVLTGPHSAWGWVVEIGLGLGGLWLVGFWLVCLIGWCVNGPSRPVSARPGAEVARTNEYRRAIDRVYDRAEHEVQAAIRRSRND
jgi:hypothetical protein